MLYELEGFSLKASKYRVPHLSLITHVSHAVYLPHSQYARHKHFINTYVLHYMRDDTNLSVDVPKYKTDYDILKDEHRYASWVSNARHCQK